MTFWFALRRLLAVLAVASLALTPVTASAVSGSKGMSALPAPGHGSADVDGSGHDMGSGHEMAGMAMDEMPCCPKEKPAMPDCGKGCPVMALCLANLVTVVPTVAAVPARLAVNLEVAWSGGMSFASLTQAPPPRPPQA